MAENPSSSLTAGTHAFATESTHTTAGYTGDEDCVADCKVRDTCPQGINDSDSFMAEDTPRGAGWDIALENVQVCAADGGMNHPNDGVGGDQ